MWGRLTAGQVPVIVPHWAFAETLRAALEVPAGSLPPASMPGTSNHQVPATTWLPCLPYVCPSSSTALQSLVQSMRITLALTVHRA